MDPIEPLSLKELGLMVPIDSRYAVDERLLPRLKNALTLPSCSQSHLFKLTKTWDKGCRKVREKILNEFVEHMANATAQKLEKEFNNGASLFLTRISAWLRLTYLLGVDLSLQLKAISIFISSASGVRFLTEFLEVGGVLTVLEILTLPQANEVTAD